MAEEKSKYDTSSVLLIVFVIITFVTSVSIAIIQSLVGNWYKTAAVTVILLCMQILRIVSYFLPALAIKDRTLKIIGIVLTSIMVVYLVCSPLLSMLKLNSTI